MNTHTRNRLALLFWAVALSIIAFMLGAILASHNLS